jgi:hypothetical protein
VYKDFYIEVGFAPLSAMISVILKESPKKEFFFLISPRELVTTQHVLESRYFGRAPTLILLSLGCPTTPLSWFAHLPDPVWRRLHFSPHSFQDSRPLQANEVRRPLCCVAATNLAGADSQHLDATIPQPHVGPPPPPSTNFASAFFNALHSFLSFTR